MNAHTYDAVVVGARCAGTATAMLMARRGLKVLLVERSAPGAETVSSHNLTRGAVLQLARWGLTDRLLERGTPRVVRTTLHFGKQILPIDLRPALGAPGVLGTRRPVLDTTLAEAAAEAGAEVRYHTSFRDVIRDETGRVTGAVLTDGAGIDLRVQASLVIGADGIRSGVARRVGAQTRSEARHALGHIYGYFKDLPLTENHGFFADKVTIGSMPTNDGATVVIASTPPDRLRAMRTEADELSVLMSLAHEASAGFGSLLSAAVPVEQVRVFAGTRGFVRDCAGPGWALVGDAGYFRDPVTAHGITDAFRDAELLADAAASGSDAALATYQRLRDEVTSELWEVTDRIAALDMDVPTLAAAFHDLARAMRREQSWMEAAFTQNARAA